MSYFRPVFLSLLLVLPLGYAFAEAPKPKPDKKSDPWRKGTPAPKGLAGLATIKNAKDEEVGLAMINEFKKGVSISLSLHDLPPGTHALHIHEKGSCVGPDFKSAGAHLNPDGHKHGKKNPSGAHLGDLPNVFVSADGTAEVTFELENASLKPGKRSLLTQDGTSIVVHAGEDDEKTDPSGGSGDRIACGVIAKQ